jgi:hypothetical protein
MTCRTRSTAPRTWLIELVYRRRDRILIATGVLLMVAYIALSLIGLGRLWVPEALQAFPVLSP